MTYMINEIIQYASPCIGPSLIEEYFVLYKPALNNHIRGDLYLSQVSLIKDNAEYHDREWHFMGEVDYDDDMSSGTQWHFKMDDTLSNYNVAYEDCSLTEFYHLLSQQPEQLAEAKQASPDLAGKPYFSKKILNQISDIFVNVAFKKNKKVLRHIRLQKVGREIAYKIGKRSRFSYGSLAPLFMKLISRNMLAQVVDEVKQQFYEEVEATCKRLRDRKWFEDEVTLVREAATVLIEGLKRCRCERDLALLFNRKRWGGWFKKQKQL